MSEKEYSYSLSGSQTQQYSSSASWSYSGYIKITYTETSTANGVVITITNIAFKTNGGTSYNGCICSGNITINNTIAASIRQASGSAINLTTSYSSVPSGYITITPVTVTGSRFTFGFSGGVNNRYGNYFIGPIYSGATGSGGTTSNLFGVPAGTIINIDLAQPFIPTDPELDFFTTNCKKNEIIYAVDKNFENLRKNLDDFIKKSTRQNPIGTQGLQNIPNKANVASSVTETQFAKVNSNPMTNAINLIYNIVHNGYMKHEGHTTQNTKINNTGSKSKNDIIPALPEYYEIVNYWDGGTSDGTLNSNSSRCNGACTGFCAGTCYGDGISGTVACSNSCGSGCDYQCGGGCSGSCGKSCSSCSSSCGSCQGSCGTNCHTNCGFVCSGGCDGECYNVNKPSVNSECCAGCNSVCGNSCKENCKGCNGTCSSGCSNCTNGCTGCGSQCIGSCKDGCKWSCSTDCTGKCDDGCSAGCGSYCAGNCIISATS